MSHHYMPLYVGDYLADTAHLTTIESGAYLHLIMHYWRRGEALDNTSDRLMHVARVSADEWAAMRAVLSEFFDISGHTWSHKRVEAELAKAASKSSKAKASAERRHSGQDANALRSQCEGKADASNSQCYPDPDPEREEEETKLPPEQAAARESAKANFDLSGVGCGLGQRAISAETKRAVAKALNIGNPGPVVEAYKAWKGSKLAKSPEAHFRKSARTIFGNLSPEDRAECQPLDEIEIKLAPVQASPQLVAALNRRTHHRHAN